MPAPPPPSVSSSEKAHLNRVKEITEIERYQSLKKDFLHDHINKINVDKKTINKINRNKITYKVNIESLDEKDQKFSIPANASPLTSVVTPVNMKNTLNWFHFADHKPISNEKDHKLEKQKVLSTKWLKNFKTRTFKDNIFNNLHKDIEDTINRKMESLQEKSLTSLQSKSINL